MSFNLSQSSSPSSSSLLLLSSSSDELYNLLLFPKVPKIPKVPLCILVSITVSSEYLHVKYNRTLSRLRIITTTNRKLTTIGQFINSIYLNFLKYENKDSTYKLLDENISIIIYDYHQSENEKKYFVLERSNEDQKEKLDQLIKILTSGKQIYIRDINRK